MLVRPRWLLVHCVLAGCLLAGCLATQSPATGFENENLLVSLPKGYKIGFQTQQDNMRMTEMIPLGETLENWTEMVTVQIFLGMRTVAPKAFERSLVRQWTSACADSESHHIIDGVENGYAFVLWMLACPKNKATGEPEVTWFKAMRGNDSFYVVQKAFKFMPNDEQVVQWTNFLKEVQVCDARLPNQPC